MQMCYFSSFVRHVVSHCIFYINLLLNLNVLVWVELHVHRFFFLDFLATSLLVYEVQNDFFFFRSFGADKDSNATWDSRL